MWSSAKNWQSITSSNGLTLAVCWAVKSKHSCACWWRAATAKCPQWFGCKDISQPALADQSAIEQSALAHQSISNSCRDVISASRRTLKGLGLKSRSLGLQSVVYTRLDDQSVSSSGWKQNSQTLTSRLCRCSSRQSPSSLLLASTALLWSFCSWSFSRDNYTTHVRKQVTSRLQRPVLG